MPERFKEEIEEILEKAEVPPKAPESQKGGKGPSRWFGLSFGGFSDTFSPGKIFVGSVALLLTALIFSVVGSGPVAPLLWIALILFVVAYAMFFVRSSPKAELRWRGRPVDYGRRSSWWQRFLRRW